MALLSRALVEQHVGPEWVDLLLPFMASEAMDKILGKLREDKTAGKKVIPVVGNVFRAFRETPLSQVRVVLIGQDVYPKEAYATGIAFGVPEDIKPPESLRQIIKAIENDAYAGLNLQAVENGIDRTLVSWSKQGVLMFNCALTTVEGAAGEHLETWRPFAEYFVAALQEVKRRLIWLAWGAPAQQITKDINQYLQDHYLLTEEHPVKASYEKRQWATDHFSRTNAIIIANQLGEPIKWL